MTTTIVYSGDLEALNDALANCADGDKVFPRYAPRWHGEVEVADKCLIIGYWPDIAAAYGVENGADEDSEEATTKAGRKAKA